MTEPTTNDNVVQLTKNYEAAKKRTRKSGSPPPPPPTEPPDEPPGSFFGPPERLPADSPVQALGMNGREYYFKTARNQYMMLLDKEINLNPITGIFGGCEYLRKHWPRYGKPVPGSPPRVVGWDQAAVRDVLIGSAHDKGLWTPKENVRGEGSWVEEDGTLVMHCGDKLFTSTGMEVAPGLRGKLFYPSAPPQPHPDKSAPAGPTGPAGTLLSKLKTWNWERGELDARLHLAWMLAGMLSAALEFRPPEWITGGSGTGKSKLLKLTRWVFGPHGMITSEDATEAYIKREIGNRSLPVSIDESESEQKSDKLRALVKLARIAATGGESGRSSSGTETYTFVARSTMGFSSIVMPSLPQQDKNRMFVGQLNSVEWEGALPTREPGEDFDPDDEDDLADTILGSKAEWENIGRKLRGRALSQWSRFRKTFRAYHRALEAVGHKSRGCDVFGTLGACHDVAFYDGFDPQRALDWASKLPAANLAETSGYSETHEACLAHMLGAQIDAWKGGMKESVARLLRRAREELDGTTNDRSCTDALLMIGIKVFHDARTAPGEPKVFWIAISNTHPGLARIFNGTDWHGLAGAPGAWSQMMGRLHGAVGTNSKGNRLKLRFDGPPQYCTALPWETVLPDVTKNDDDVEFVAERDR